MYVYMENDCLHTYYLEKYYQIPFKVKKYPLRDSEIPIALAMSLTLARAEIVSIYKTMIPAFCLYMGILIPFSLYSYFLAQYALLWVFEYFPANCPFVLV